MTEKQTVGSAIGETFCGECLELSVWKLCLCWRCTLTNPMEQLFAKYFQVSRDNLNDLEDMCLAYM